MGWAMESRPELYRRRSLECLQAAQRVVDPKAKASFLELAERWRELAEQADDLEQEQRNRGR